MLVGEHGNHSRSNSDWISVSVLLRFVSSLCRSVEIGNGFALMSSSRYSRPAQGPCAVPWNHTRRKPVRECARSLAYSISEQENYLPLLIMYGTTTAKKKTKEANIKR